MMLIINIFYVFFIKKLPLTFNTTFNILFITLKLKIYTNISFRFTTYSMADQRHSYDLYSDDEWYVEIINFFYLIHFR